MSHKRKIKPRWREAPHPSIPFRHYSSALVLSQPASCNWFPSVPIRTCHLPRLPSHAPLVHARSHVFLSANLSAIKIQALARSANHALVVSPNQSVPRCSSLVHPDPVHKTSIKVHNQCTNKTNKTCNLQSIKKKKRLDHTTCKRHQNKMLLKETDKKALLWQ